MENFIKDIQFKISKDSNELYHSRKEYIGASGLKLLKESPLHFKEAEQKETDALVFGSAYHTYVLEPELFDKEYFIFDETDILDILKSEGSKSPRATNKYKDWKLEQEAKSGGRTILDLGTMSILKAMKERLMSHRYVRSLLSNGDAEMSVYTEIEMFSGKSVKVKIRPDFWKPKKRIIVDLKTTADASKDGFTKHATDLNYHIQSALYTDIIEKIEGTGMPYSFFFIAQEKTKPFAFNIFESSPQFQGTGRYEYEQLLMLYQWCQENNRWPGYQIFCENKYGILSLNLPPYGIKEINWFIHDIPKEKESLNN